MATPSPSCMANPNWNILQSKNITCCFSQKLEAVMKTSYTPMLPIKFAAAGLGAAVALLFVGIILTRGNNAGPETESLTGRAEKLSPGKILLASCNVILAMGILAMGILGIVESNKQSYCSRSWPLEDLNVCICLAPN